MSKIALLSSVGPSRESMDLRRVSGPPTQLIKEQMMKKDKASGWKNRSKPNPNSAIHFPVTSGKSPELLVFLRFK